MFAKQNNMMPEEASARTYCARTKGLDGGTASHGGKEDHGLLHLDGRGVVWCSRAKVARLVKDVL